MCILRSVLACLASVLVLAGCEMDPPQPEPAAPKASAAPERPASLAPNAAEPESENCCGAEMCKRVTGGCGCRKGGNKNANCGG